MYNQSGDIVSKAHEFGNKIDKIPAGTYTLEQNPQTGEFYLLKSPNFNRPAKVYGEIKSRTQKVLNTFHSRKGKNTGVLLSGTKGSGKTQLAKDVSLALLDEGIPTIIIQNCYTDGTFINFIKSIEDKALVLFDEFEKVYYEQEHQESILTLLDGTGSYNKLYMLTSNNKDVSEFLLNRPSRIFYHFEYKKLSKSVMLEFLEDTLNDKKHIPSFDKLYDVTNVISFDMIQCLVEELNRYPEQRFVDTFRELNVTIETSVRNAFTVKSFKINGKDIKVKDNVFSTTGFGFISGYDNLRAFFVVEEGMLSTELKNIGAYVTDDYLYSDAPEQPEGTIAEVEYGIRFDYNKADCFVDYDTIRIKRDYNGTLVEVEYVKAADVDILDIIFGK